jgi:hypothetical protein
MAAPILRRAIDSQHGIDPELSAFQQLLGTLAENPSVWLSAIDTSGSDARPEGMARQPYRQGEQMRTAIPSVRHEAQRRAISQHRHLTCAALPHALA